MGVRHDLYRFYVATFAPPSVGLPEDQSHHALHVLRLEAGARVIVFDGRGSWAEGVLRPERRGTFVDILGEVHADPAPRLHLTLATAVPKADRAEWLVEQASQLGVAAVQWLDTDRAVVKPKESGGKMDKYRRLALESAKQCGRTHVMAVAPMRDLADVLSAGRSETLLWLEPREGRSVSELVGGSLLPAAGRITALVGPEGGWSQREADMLAGHAGIVRVRLTDTILRIETACAAIAAILMAH